jgi:hypothetical protein
VELARLLAIMHQLKPKRCLVSRPEHGHCRTFFSGIEAALRPKLAKGKMYHNADLMHVVEVGCVTWQLELVFRMLSIASCRWPARATPNSCLVVVAISLCSLDIAGTLRPKKNAFTQPLLPDSQFHTRPIGHMRSAKVAVALIFCSQRLMGRLAGFLCRCGSWAANSRYTIFLQASHFSSFPRQELPELPTTWQLVSLRSAPEVACVP